MNKKLLLTLVTAGVATAVLATRRKNPVPLSTRLRDVERPLAQRRTTLVTDADGDFDDRYDSGNDALALLVTVDEHTLALAEQVLARTHDEAVREFAQTLLDAHTENLAATQAFDADVIATAEISELRARHETDLTQLATLDEIGFETTFIDAVVDEHGRALELIDALLPDIQDETVRDHVAATRAHLAQHLLQAQQLQASR